MCPPRKQKTLPELRTVVPSIKPGPTGSVATTGTTSERTPSPRRARKPRRGEHGANICDLLRTPTLAWISATSVVTSADQPQADCTCTPCCVRLRLNGSASFHDCHIHRPECRTKSYGVFGGKISVAPKWKRTTRGEAQPDMFPSTSQND